MKLNEQFKLESPLRRQLLHGAAASMLMMALPSVRADRVGAPSIASDLKMFPVKTHHDLILARTKVNITGEPASAVTLNGTVPGPLLHFREGDEVTINLKNELEETTSIHWHGLLVPNAMDGVPGVTFPGIKPGETFLYKFTLRQSGTYWYHSHAILQEPAGFYAPIVIEPAKVDPIRSDRDYVILLSDWIDMPPERVLANLKKADGYYNYRRQTIKELLDEYRAAKTKEERQAIRAERLGWAKMRMDPTDYSDGGPEWSFLMQGARPDQNWTALFTPGERIRLRFINGAAMNFFDVSIPGLDMTVVAADGQAVSPVNVREFRIGNGETYDVIVQPKERKAFTIYAATMARIGFAKGTLAPELGMQAPIPELGTRPVRALRNMAGIHSSGGHDQRDISGAHDSGARNQRDMAGTHDGSENNQRTDKAKTQDKGVAHSAASLQQPTVNFDHQAHGGQPVVVSNTPMEAHAGMAPSNTAGGAGILDKLAYKDLRALAPATFDPAIARAIQVDLTGDMNRYIWSINGKKLSDATFFEAKVGELLRFNLTNKTMMEHPMHLHGTFFMVDNGQGAYSPQKHTVVVAPGETMALYAVFDEKGGWVFHCHLFYHAAAGMVQAVIVS